MFFRFVKECKGNVKKCKKRESYDGMNARHKTNQNAHFPSQHILDIFHSCIPCKQKTKFQQVL